MANVAHSTLTGADLHEPKGAAAATSGQVYVANGAGSGAWTTPTEVVFMQKHIAGLTYDNAADATNDITILAGSCRDTTNTEDMTLASSLTKQLDAAWAVGTNQGGLDTGAIANTTYHIWLIKRTDTDVVDALFSTSATAPTMPTNYTKKRRIGSFQRISAAIQLFVTHELGGGGLQVSLSTIPTATTIASSTSGTLTVITGLPTGIAFAPLGAYSNSSGTTIALSSAGATPSATAQGTPDGITYSLRSDCISDTSAQLKATSASATPSSTYRLFGWTDFRRD